MKTGEDYEYPWLFNSFERLLRIVGMIIGITLPGFWVALAAFHPDQIPLVFLSSASQARQGIPLPTPVEALILVLLFDLLKEAGLRLPFSVGQILGVVGGLIIGDAAIRAGITSPANVVMIATSTVATFTISNQSLSGIVSLIRIFILIISSFLGLFGFFVATFFVLIHIANLRSFNLPYLAPLAPFTPKDIVNSLFHMPEKLKKTRFKMLRVRDSKRGGE
ncbi:spore germination protein [Piscibacillus salipiscarius]|uniref:spore germination protein n=1 Tax=Piscibacillus salipiscarius TaxID=299480 RepID=UPI0024370EEB|nr:spore germination protein [Piscibacillus salipiscarius]